MTIAELKAEILNSIQQYYHRDAVIELLERLEPTKKQLNIFDNL
jgi:hypothetical protein